MKEKKISKGEGQGLDRRNLLKTGVVGAAAVGLFGLEGTIRQVFGATSVTKGTTLSKPDVDAAKKEGTVSLYSSLDTAIIDRIIKPFTDKYGIKVTYYRATAAAVASKLLNEWDAKRHFCDVLDVSDVAAANMMKRRGMLAKYRPASLDAYPKEMRDKDGFWTANRLTQIILGYNTKSITGDMVPKGWLDLVDPKFSGKMVVQEPSTFAPRVHTVVINIKDGWDWLAKIGKNKPKFVQTVQVMGQMNETGEVPISIFQNDNIVTRARANGKPVDMVFPKEGVPCEAGVIACMNEASHPNAARLLIDWWLGEEGQKANVDGFKYSPRPDMDPPKGCPRLKDLTLWQPDYDYLELHMNEVIDKITKVLNG